MNKRKIVLIVIAVTVMSVLITLSNISVSASSLVLNKGMQGTDVKQLQNDLKKLGYFTYDATGYFGDITLSSVKKLQRDYGYYQDGVVGSKTFSLIESRLNSISQNSSVIMKGSSGSRVTAFQKDLRNIGYFNMEPTGYFGDITMRAVKWVQKDYGYTQDGIAGKATFALIDKLLGRTKSTISRGGSGQNNYLMPWFGGVENIFKIGMTATVYDIETGLSFTVKRTYGTNHADSEPLTAEDTAIMKRIYGGTWSWSRKSVIITVDGYKFAASIIGMPHAGLERYAANKYVSSRSGGFGYGVNLDAVKGNNMDGHFCMHFYNSRTHGTNTVDSTHQEMLKKAADWANKNY